MNINEALSTLDPTNDTHWTADGVPRIDHVSNILGRGVTRKEITDAAPELTRATAAAARESAPTPAPAIVADEKGADATPAADAPPADAPPAELTEDQKVAARALEDQLERNREDVVRAATPEAAAAAVDAMRAAVAAAPEPSRDAVRAAKEREAKLLVGESERLSAQIADLMRRKANVDAQHSVIAAQLEIVGKGHEAAHRENIGGYLERQQQIREERAGRQRALAESGIKLDDIVRAVGTRAPIDTAFAGKRGHGLNRPKVPVHQGGAAQ